MKLDWYTKALLTVIALSLCAIALRPLSDPIIAKAGSGVDGMDDIHRDLEKIGRSIDRMESYGIKIKEMPRSLDSESMRPTDQF